MKFSPATLLCNAIIVLAKVNKNVRNFGVPVFARVPRIMLEKVE